MFTLVASAPAGMTTLAPLASVTVPPAEPMPVFTGGGGGGGLLLPPPSSPPPPPHAAEIANTATRIARLPKSKNVMVHPAGNSPVCPELRRPRWIADMH